MDDARILFREIESQGVTWFDNLLAQPTIETDLLDFKLVKNSSAASLVDEDRRNLSKAVGGFGNTDGGVIVWGVDCSKVNGRDVVQKLVPFENLAGFTAHLNDNINKVVQPPVAGVKNLLIPLQPGSDQGYVATYVPQIDGLPVQSTMKDLNKAIYFRSGSNFEVMTQTMLADRFGRRPQPNLKLVAWRAGIAGGYDMFLALENSGRGVALNPAIAIYQCPFDVQLVSDANMMVSQHHSRPDEISPTRKPFFAVAPINHVIIYPDCLHKFGYAQVPSAKVEEVFNIWGKGYLELDYVAYADQSVNKGTLRVSMDDLRKTKRIYPIEGRP